MNIRYVFAFLLIFFGSVLLLEKFGILSLFEYLFDWWPTGLIAVGAYLLWNDKSSWITGSVIVTIGVILQADYLKILPVSLWEALWPIVLILTGIYLISGKRKYDSHKFSKKKEASDADSDKLEEIAVFSGINKRINNPNLSGGDLSSIFGGIELDLINSDFIRKEIVFDVFCIFGGVKLYIPPTWNVVTNGVPIFGGLKNNSRHREETDTEKPVLYINYVAIFGGIEIVN
jgi:predicted membrane protein